VSIEQRLQPMLTMIDGSCDVAEFDECATDAHGCHHECVNTLGGFQCKCRIGYELHSDGRQCEGKLKLTLGFVFVTEAARALRYRYLSK